MIELILYGILAFAVLLLAEAVYHLVRYSGERQRAELRQRLRSLGQTGTASLLKERRLAKNRYLNRLLGQFAFAERLERILLQTDLNWTVGTVIAAALSCATIVTVALSILTRGSSVLPLIGIPIGCAIPILYIINARTKRSRKVSEQMPDAMDMMSRSLQAGHGVSAAFKLVATEMPPPIAVEFGRCFEENNLGVEFRDSVTNLANRMPDNLDIKLFAVSLVVQNETGGNLVEILDKIAMTIRERYKFYGKVRALTAEGKVSGVILGSLPFLFSTAIMLLNPGYLRPLIEDPLGTRFLATGLILWALGVFWLVLMARVEY